ncbi:MAG: NAD-binding protein [Prochloraceae cyanobacterium]|nr:NAD-binding protein [Prochloraceae cyanobacterium]
MKPEIIVCGLGGTGYKIFKLLREEGVAVVGINPDPIPGERENIVIGDLRSEKSAIEAGIKEAHTLVIATNDDALNLAILAMARLLNPRLRVVNRLFNHALGERLDHTLPEHYSMSVSGIAAPIFTFAALGDRAIGQLRLFDRTWPVREEKIDEHHRWKGKKLSELWDNLSQMLIYYLPTEGKSHLIEGVLQEQTLQLGDRLIVGDRPNSGKVRRARVRKMLKAIFNLQRYQQYVRPVIIVNLALLVIISIATLTYVCFDLDASIVDALYFTVGMITGAGGKEEVGELAPDSIKILTTIMMILGTGIIGIFYALTNDFILGSRIKQFWDAARVPHHNHYIVCGLGIMGLQILRQLHDRGYEVVAVESDPNNRFLHTARSLGIPVIIDNATFPAALEAANIQRAECLIAVTSKDMSNVEIALTAKAVAPKISVVLRIQDSRLARSVREVFEFENVLCPREIATPSFVAAALGGRILGNGITKDLLWVALATMITPGHPWNGKMVKEAATLADFVPLYLENNQQQNVHGWELLETALHSGDVLYLAMPATQLDQLYSSDSSPKTPNSLRAKWCNRSGKYLLEISDMPKN